MGSIGKALRFVEAHEVKERGEEGVAEELMWAEAARIEDLTVYFALNQFQRRKPYKHLEPGLKRDIKQFFGDYRSARSAGWDLLLQIAEASAVEQACREAAEHGLGWLATEEVLDADGEPGEGERSQRALSLQLDARLVEQLPGLLRVYVGAAAAA